MVRESGNVDQIPRLTNEVISATKICCVRANPVDPIASKIPATCEIQQSSARGKILGESREKASYYVLRNVCAGCPNCITQNRHQNGQDEHFSPTKNLAITVSNIKTLSNSRILTSPNFATTG